jgi:small conductance mechanosensitive channel
MLSGMNIESYINLIEGWLIRSGPRVAMIILGAFLFMSLVKIVIRLVKGTLKARNPSPEFQKRVNTFGSVVMYMADIVVVSAALILVINEFGIDVRPILAAAGVVGLAVGFGAQKLVQDIISGFFILLEDQIRVGDVVEVGGKSGVVESVNLRLVVLRDLHGNVHFIRTGQIDTVTNMTKDFSHYVFDMGVAYKEDVDEVMEAIRAVDGEMRSDPEYSGLILEPIEILGLDRFEDSAVIVRARTKTVPIEQWKVGREFNRRLKKKFESLGMEAPYPHMVVKMAAEGEGVRGK